MATVTVSMVSAGILASPERLRPSLPPLFDDSAAPITEQDRQHARELILALDPDSRAAYREHFAHLFPAEDI